MSICAELGLLGDTWDAELKETTPSGLCGLVSPGTGIAFLAVPLKLPHLTITDVSPDSPMENPNRSLKEYGSINEGGGSFLMSV
jgi:hypothetical protein